ncbi:hypothetical protein MTO96_020144 [Rhipicephalus appendiculatus]
MIAAAAFLGTTCGSRMCLQAPAMIMDFGISTLPMMMGGLVFLRWCVHADSAAPYRILPRFTWRLQRTVAFNGGSQCFLRVHLGHEGCY